MHNDKLLHMKGLYENKNLEVLVCADRSFLNSMLIKNYEVYYNHFMALWILSVTNWMSWYHNKHSPIHTYRVISQPLSASSIYYDSWHPHCSTYMPDSLFAKSLSMFSVVYLLVWHPPLHTPHIFSPNIVFLLQHMPIP